MPGKFCLPQQAIGPGNQIQPWHSRWQAFCITGGMATNTIVPATPAPATKLVSPTAPGAASALAAGATSASPGTSAGRAVSVKKPKSGAGVSAAGNERTVVADTGATASTTGSTSASSFGHALASAVRSARRPVAPHGRARTAKAIPAGRENTSRGAHVHVPTSGRQDPMTTKRPPVSSSTTSSLSGVRSRKSDASRPTAQDANVRGHPVAKRRPTTWPTHGALLPVAVVSDVVARAPANPHKTVSVSAHARAASGPSEPPAPGAIVTGLFSRQLSAPPAVPASEPGGTKTGHSLPGIPPAGPVERPAHAHPDVTAQLVPRRATPFRTAHAVSLATEIAVRMNIAPSRRSTTSPSTASTYQSEAAAKSMKQGGGANQTTTLALPLIVVDGVNQSAAAVLPAGAPATASQGAVPSSPSTPATQLAAALVNVGSLPAGERGQGGVQGTRLTIALAPPAIGTVTLQIDRNADGSSVVTIGASHATTLDQLQNDRLGLEQMLTQAGVPVDHRAVSFHLVAPHAETAVSPQTAGGGGAAAFGFGTGAGGQGGSQPRAGGGGAPAGASTAGMRADGTDGEIVAPRSDIPLPVPSGLRRFGVNVMV